MQEENKKGFLDKFQAIMMPIGDFLANEKHFAAISAGLMSTVGLTLAGAVFQIIANPPVTQEMIQKGGLLATLFGGWYHFAIANKELLMTPYNMTVGLFSITAAFAIAYQLAKKYNMPAMSAGVVSLTVFLLTVAPVKTYMLEDKLQLTALDTTYLGGSGLFTAIIVGLVTVEIAHLCKKNNITIRMPDVVPPFLSDSFSALIPLLLNIFLFFGINIGIQSFDPSLNLPSAIMKILAAPLSAINSVPGMLFVIAFATMLWCCGVHGSMIVYPLVIPMVIEVISKNAALVAAGQPAEFSPVLLFTAMQIVGGTGNTLGFVLLASFKAKSAQLKAIGKVSLIPGIFGINEPMIFGAPIVFNPILMIPFVLGSVIVGLLLWLGFMLGLRDISYILVLSALPIGISGFVQAMSIKSAIFEIALIPILMVVWYPFFKIYDRQLLKKEEAAALEEAIES